MGNAIKPTCECGLSYVIGNVQDETMHELFHKHFEIGVPLNEGAQELPRTQIQGRDIIVIDSSVPKAIRQGFHDLLLAAHRNLPKYPIGYDGHVDERQQTLFVLAEENRAVGFTVFSIDSGFWILTWSNGLSIQLVDTKAELVDRWTLGRIWLAKHYRHKGIGRELLLKSCELVETDSKDIGIELPLTPEARRLIHNVCPGRWYGRGDCNSLHTTLEPFQQTASADDC